MSEDEDPIIDGHHEDLDLDAQQPEAALSDDDWDWLLGKGRWGQ